ncbi:MAG: hypothetical protein AAFY69_08785 [Pseudomonadota bacterium]
MEIRTGSIRFGRSSGSGPRTSFQDVALTNAPTQATAIMTGMRSAFSRSDGDHHLGNLEVRLNAAVSGSNVRVTATFGLRDWSGNWDDDYEGEVFFAVVAD